MRKRQNREKCFFSKLKETKNGLEQGTGDAVLEMEFLAFWREKELLLSRFLGDPTVGFRRSKKESCFMQRNLRVGSGFGSF